MKYKLAVFDIDGTLLSYSSKAIDPRTKTWFKQLNENGIITVLASGRDYVSIGDVYQFLEPNYFIGANGGFIDKMENGITTNILNNAINIDDFKKYYNEILLQNKDLVVNVVLSDKNSVFIWDFRHLDNHWFWKDHKDKFRKIEDFEKNLDLETFSLVSINSTDEQLIKISKQFFAQTNSSLFVQAQWSNGFFAASKGTNKYSTILELAQQLKIKNSEIIAFGDGNNDYEMIKNVGHGVAVGNAEPSLKKVAKATTDSVDNDGVYKYLKKIELL